MKWCEELLTWIWRLKCETLMSMSQVRVIIYTHHSWHAYVYIYIERERYCVCCMFAYIFHKLRNVYCTALHPFSFLGTVSLKKYQPDLSLGQAPCTRVNRVFNLVWFTAHKHRSHIRWVLSWGWLAWADYLWFKSIWWNGCWWCVSFFVCRWCPILEKA